MKAEFRLLSQGISRSLREAHEFPRPFPFRWSRKEGGQGSWVEYGVEHTSSFCRKEKQYALCLEQAGHGEDTAGELDYWEQRAYRSHEDEGGTTGKQ